LGYVFGEWLRSFRKRENLSQEELAKKVGVHRNTISAWERSLYLPRVRDIEMILTNFLGLSPEDASKLFEFQRNLSSPELPSAHWGEAPDTESFYGRQDELAQLRQWIVTDRCRIVALCGFGGMGKTALATYLARVIQPFFSYLFWYSLRNAPPLEQFLKRCILFLSNQQQFDLPGDTNEQITLLIDYLQKYRCLLVLDNFDALLQAGHLDGQYMEGNEGYGKLLQRIGTAEHQSCLLLTSREKPSEITPLEGETSSVRLLLLGGVDVEDGKDILKSKGLHGSAKAWSALIRKYSGNPLALQLVAQPIRKLFGSSIANFLNNGGTLLVGDVHNLMTQQFQRLSPLEQTIMYWLAIERESITLAALQEDLLLLGPQGVLIDALISLKQRSMIEGGRTNRFTLQPVIMEYVTERFVGLIRNEIETEAISLLASHALLKAQATDHLRDIQTRFILKPVADWLSGALGKEESEEKLQRILSHLQEKQRGIPSYAAGNILNVLLQLPGKHRGYNFSHLVVWDAYLQGKELYDVNFAHATLEKSVFTDTFGTILSVAFSPNGKLLAAGTATGEVRIWEVASRIPYMMWQAHKDWIRCVAFNLDGKILASSSSDHTVKLWEVSTGKLIATLEGHTARVRLVAFSPDGKLLASGSSDHTVRLWNTETGECHSILEGHSNGIRTIAFSPIGAVLASGGDDQTIRLWNTETGECHSILEGHSNGVRSVAFNPTGAVLASGGDDQSVRLWEVREGKLLQILEGHVKRVRVVAFSPDGNVLASGGDDRTIRLWEMSSHRCFYTLLGHNNGVRTVAFSPDGTILASGSEDRAVLLWEVSSGHRLYTLQGHANGVRSIAFSPDGKTIVSGSEDYTVRLWEVSTDLPLNVLRGHTSRVLSVAYSATGEIFASGSEDYTARIWRSSDGRCLHLLQEHTGRIRAIALDPTGKVLATGSDDRTVRLWDIRTGKCFQILYGHTLAVRSVAFSPDGITLASGSDDYTVRIWNVVIGECLYVLPKHPRWVWSVAFSPDGRVLASGSLDIRLWEVRTGRHLKRLPEEHEGERVWALSFSPNGSILASGGDEYDNLRLWNAETGKCLHTLVGHTSGIRGIAFNPHGNILASGSHDGTIKYWEVLTGTLIKTMLNDRPYEHMNITSVDGLTQVQKDDLKILGAFAEPERTM
jgi:WD40 repeat protein/transcriptional regulator with XRE-family HTH domain